MQEVLASLLDGQILNQEMAKKSLRGILSTDIAPSQAAAFLTAIQMRGVHLPEFAGFVEVLRENGKKLDFSDFELVDVCGTGGDGKHTFNISTAAAFVLAGAGVKVAKHGNYSATSGCGSSDVLQFLGVKFIDDESKLREQLEKFNICYLHAPLFQTSLKTIAPLRREIGFRTFFNLLGPLLNPAAPQHQLIGVAEPFTMRLYRYFLEDSDVNFALVHSRAGFDEISLTSAFDVVTNNRAKTFYPEDLNFATIEPQELDGGNNVAEAAQKLGQILNCQATQNQTRVVIINAAFAINLMFPEFSFAECCERAEQSLKSGRAFQTLQHLIEF